MELRNVLERLNNILNAEIDPAIATLFKSSNPVKGEWTPIFTYVTTKNTDSNKRERVCIGDYTDLFVDEFHLYTFESTMFLVIVCANGYLLARFSSALCPTRYVPFETSKVSEVVPFIDRYIAALTLWHTRMFSSGTLINWIAGSDCLSLIQLKNPNMVLALNMTTQYNYVGNMDIRFVIVP